MTTVELKHTRGPWNRLGNRQIVAAHGAGLPICEIWPNGVGVEQADANERLIATAPQLLAELIAAHQIIRNALNLMTTDQKLDWGRLNARDDVDGEGVTRANERAAVIVWATGA